MRGHNIGFYWEIRKIIFELSLIPPLIWSSAFICQRKLKIFAVLIKSRLSVKQSCDFTALVNCSFCYHIKTTGIGKVIWIRLNWENKKAYDCEWLGLLGKQLCHFSQWVSTI